MKTSRRTVLAIVVIAAIEGLIAQEVLLSRALGLNMAILCFVGAALLAIGEWTKRIDLKGYRVFVYSSLTVAAYGFGVTSSDGINALNIAMLMLMLGFVAFRNQFKKLPSLAESLFIAPLSTIYAPVIAFYLKSKTEGRAEPGRKVQVSEGQILGGLLAIPVLVAFGALFAQADPMFNKVVSLEFVSIPASLGTRALIFASTVIVAIGLMMMILPQFTMVTKTADEANPHYAQPTFSYTPYGRVAVFGPPAPTKEGMPTIESTKAFTTFFTMLGALFLFFIIVQLRYLFGGNDVVLQTTGLTYAQYARRGFFELVTVILITLPMLLLAQEWLAKSADTPKVPIQRIVIGFSILLGVLLASAAYRMSLYISAYGLSTARFYVYAAIVWLACAVAAYGVLGFKWKLANFPKIVFTAAMFVVLACNFSRPDNIIAKVNLRQRNVDFALLSKLGEDARDPILASDIPKLKEAYLNARNEFRFNWKDASLQELLARR